MVKRITICFFLFISLGFLGKPVFAIAAPVIISPTNNSTVPSVNPTFQINANGQQFTEWTLYKGSGRTNYCAQGGYPWGQGVYDDTITATQLLQGAAVGGYDCGNNEGVNGVLMDGATYELQVKVYKDGEGYSGYSYSIFSVNAPTPTPSPSPSPTPTPSPTSTPTPYPQTTIDQSACIGWYGGTATYNGVNKYQYYIKFRDDVNYSGDWGIMSNQITNSYPTSFRCSGYGSPWSDACLRSMDNYHGDAIIQSYNYSTSAGRLQFIETSDRITQFRIGYNISTWGQSPVYCNTLNSCVDTNMTDVPVTCDPLDFVCAIKKWLYNFGVWLFGVPSCSIAQAKFDSLKSLLDAHLPFAYVNAIGTLDFGSIPTSTQAGTLVIPIRSVWNGQPYFSDDLTVNDATVAPVRGFINTFRSMIQVILIISVIGFIAFNWHKFL